MREGLGPKFLKSFGHFEAKTFLSFNYEGVGAMPMVCAFMSKVGLLPFEDLRIDRFHVRPFLFRKKNNGKGESRDYYVNSRYRCNHNTRYERTSNMNAVQCTNPSKQRSKNTRCPFLMTVKVRKEVSKNLKFLNL